MRVTIRNASRKTPHRVRVTPDPALRGAMFFAVCRGKVSEGLNFADKAGRAVIITGALVQASPRPSCAHQLARTVQESRLRCGRIPRRAFQLREHGVARLTLHPRSSR